MVQWKMVCLHISFFSFRVIFHFHDYGRTGIYRCQSTDLCPNSHQQHYHSPASFSFPILGVFEPKPQRLLTGTLQGWTGALLVDDSQGPDLMQKNHMLESHVRHFKRIHFGQEIALLVCTFFCRILFFW